MKTGKTGSKYQLYGRMANRKYFSHGEHYVAYELQIYKASLLEEPEEHQKIDTKYDPERE